MCILFLFQSSVWRTVRGLRGSCSVTKLPTKLHHQADLLLLHHGVSSVWLVDSWLCIKLNKKVTWFTAYVRWFISLSSRLQLCLVSLQFSKLQWMTLWSCLTEPMRTLGCSARWLGHILVSLRDVCPKLHTSLLNTSCIQCLHSVCKLSVKQWTLPTLNECHGRKNYLYMDANVYLEMADCFPLLMDDYLSNINNIWVLSYMFLSEAGATFANN